MKPSVLSATNIEQFIERGWTKLPQAYSEKQAADARDFLWAKLAQRGCIRDDPSSWTQPMQHIQEGYADSVLQACSTDRLIAGVEDLLGAGRCRSEMRTGKWGWWPVNFAVGADQPWDVPNAGWHWDGQHFRHAVDAPDQGLLLLCIFSAIGSHGGATLIAEGSHHVVARFLSNYPDGIEHKEALAQCPAQHPWLAELMGLRELVSTTGRIKRFMDSDFVDAHGTRLRVVEATASPGDVFLCHPFLYHAGSQNHSGKPRFLCNRTTPLKERLQLQRSDGDYSPLEISIKYAIER